MAVVSFVERTLRGAAPAAPAGQATYQSVSADAAQNGYAISRTSSDILVRLADAPGVDLNFNGTFARPSAETGDRLTVVRQLGGTGLWSLVGGDSSDVLRGRDDVLEYQCIAAPSTWARVLPAGRDKRLVYRLDGSTTPTLLLDGGWDGVDIVVHSGPCAVTGPQALGTRFHCRLIQADGNAVSFAAGSGATLLAGAPAATSGQGQELDVLVVQNATGTAAVYRTIRMIPDLGALAVKDKIEVGDFADFGAGQIVLGGEASGAPTLKTAQDLTDQPAPSSDAAAIFWPAGGGAPVRVRWAIIQALGASAAFTPFAYSAVTGTSHAPTNGGWFEYTNAGAVAVAVGAAFIANGEALLQKGAGSGVITVTPAAGYTWVGGSTAGKVLTGLHTLKRKGSSQTLLELSDVDPYTIYPAVTFANLAKFAGVKGTAAAKTGNYNVVAADSGQLHVCTSTLTATFPAVSTLAPNAGDLFFLDLHADGVAVTIDGPGGTNVAMVAGDLARVYARNGGKMIVTKSAATVIS